MQQLAGVPRGKRTNAEAVPRDHQASNNREYMLDEATQRSDEVIRRVCHLYEAVTTANRTRGRACEPAGGLTLRCAILHRTTRALGTTDLSSAGKEAAEARVRLPAWLKK